MESELAKTTAALAEVEADIVTFEHSLEMAKQRKVSLEAQRQKILEEEESLRKQKEEEERVRKEKEEQELRRRQEEAAELELERQLEETRLAEVKAYEQRIADLHRQIQEAEEAKNRMLQSQNFSSSLHKSPQVAREEPPSSDEKKVQISKEDDTTVKPVRKWGARKAIASVEAPVEESPHPPNAINPIAAETEGQEAQLEPAGSCNEIKNEPESPKRQFAWEKPDWAVPDSTIPEDESILKDPIKNPFLKEPNHSGYTRQIHANMDVHRSDGTFVPADSVIKPRLAWIVAHIDDQKVGKIVMHLHGKDVNGLVDRFDELKGKEIDPKALLVKDFDPILYLSTNKNTRALNNMSGVHGAVQEGLEVLQAIQGASTESLVTIKQAHIFPLKHAGQALKERQEAEKRMEAKRREEEEKRREDQAKRREAAAKKWAEETKRREEERKREEKQKEEEASRHKEAFKRRGFAARNKVDCVKAREAEGSKSKDEESQQLEVQTKTIASSDNIPTEEKAEKKEVKESGEQSSDKDNATENGKIGDAKPVEGQNTTTPKDGQDDLVQRRALTKKYVRPASPQRTASPPRASPTTPGRRFLGSPKRSPTSTPKRVVRLSKSLTNTPNRRTTEITKTSTTTTTTTSNGSIPFMKSLAGDDKNGIEEAQSTEMQAYADRIADLENKIRLAKEKAAARQ